MYQQTILGTKLRIKFYLYVNNVLKIYITIALQLKIRRFCHYTYFYIQVFSSVCDIDTDWIY